MKMIPFYVKCAGCGRIYDSKHLRCPECDCGQIVKRMFWSKEDLERIEELKEEME